MAHSAALIKQVAERLSRTLDLRSCAFELFPFEAQLPRIEPGRIVLPATEPGLQAWSTQAGIELPVRFRGLTLGRFVLVPATPTVGVALPASARQLAIAMAAELSLSVARALIDGEPIIPDPAPVTAS